MSDAPKLTVVSFTPKVPTPRAPDLRDDVIKLLHEWAQKKDDGVAAWETHAKWVHKAWLTAVDLAEAERWDELKALFRQLEPILFKAAGSKQERVADLPDSLK